MKQSYTFNYIKIYFWQILSIILNLTSLFIVIPALSSNPKIYGIYAICVSLIIFLSYADLGFMSAGYKYASECYAVKKTEEEIKIIGFVSFILTIFVSLFALLFLYFSIFPEGLIKDIGAGKEREIASKLLLILVLFSPNIILQRSIQLIYGVRLEDYKYQKILIVIGCLKIISVFFFFNSNNYNVTGYFLFCQSVTFLGLVAALLMAAKKYRLSLKLYFTSIRFSKNIYEKIKTLAFSSLVLTISWILYYELDSYAIAKLLGPVAVAYFAVGLTCLSFFRTILGTIYNPFTARFNYFIALNDNRGLKDFYYSIICLLMPVVIYPIVSLVILAKPFVYTWVGDTFNTSVSITKWLILSNIIGFISYPMGILLMARKKIKALYYVAMILPFIYWGGILFLYKEWGVTTFAYFKFLAFMITGAFHLKFTLDFLAISLKQFLIKLIIPILPSLLLLIGLLISFSNHLPLSKNKLNLIMVISSGAFCSFLAFIAYYLTSKPFRGSINLLTNRLINLRKAV